MNDWKIDRIHACCAKCAGGFAVDASVFSVVEFDAAESPRRTDWCESCFRSHAEGTNSLIYWETRFLPPTSRRRRIDFNRLLRLFEAWVEKSSSRNPALLYLIALLLIRKRFFRMQDLVSVGGEEFLRLKRPGPTGEVLLVPAPLLEVQELPDLRRQLEQLIDGDVEDAELASIQAGIAVSGNEPADVEKDGRGG